MLITNNNPGAFYYLRLVNNYNKTGFNKTLMAQVDTIHQVVPPDISQNLLKKSLNF